jgi:hypothetical protein
LINSIVRNNQAKRQGSEFGSVVAVHCLAVGLLLENELLSALDVTACNCEELAAEVVFDVAVSWPWLQLPVGFCGSGVAEQIFGDVFRREQILLLVVQIEQDWQLATIDHPIDYQLLQLLIADDRSSYLGNDVEFLEVRLRNDALVRVGPLHSISNVEVEQIAGVRDKEVGMVVVGTSDFLFVDLLLRTDGLQILQIALHHCNKLD